eukprot:scaffold435_cov342-Pavlova_lutheri.AAC.45
MKLDPWGKSRLEYIGWLRYDSCRYQRRNPQWMLVLSSGYVEGTWSEPSSSYAASTPFKPDEMNKRPAHRRPV